MAVIIDHYVNTIGINEKSKNLKYGIKELGSINYIAIIGDIYDDESYYHWDYKSIVDNGKVGNLTMRQLSEMFNFNISMFGIINYGMELHIVSNQSISGNII